MKNAFQAICVILIAGLLTFGASRAWQHIKNQDKSLEKLIHSIEALRIASETPPTKPEVATEQASSTPSAPLFQAIDKKPSVNEATSPDGEWIADVRALGQSPFNRETSFWLELINQTGKPNRMVYLDWFERPRDARIQPYPIGWSANGRSIYLSYGNLPGAHQHEPGAYAFMNAGEVFRIRLDQSERYANDRVNPYNGSYPPNSIGRLLDIIPRQDIGLWLEEVRENEEGKGGVTKKSLGHESRLILFSLENAFAPRTLITLPTKGSARITSATISDDGTDIFYVIHEDKKNDEVFYLDISTGSTQIPTQLDLIRFGTELRKQNIKTPYTIEIEKTALTRENDLFLIFTSADRKRETYRWMTFNGQPTLGRD